jgi:hypothetical protein
MINYHPFARVSYKHKTTERVHMLCVKEEGLQITLFGKYQLFAFLAGALRDCRNSYFL